MKCKICDREINEKFYRHLNSSHKMKKGDYLKLYPEQKDEYNTQVPAVWNKGMKEGDHPSISKYAEGSRRYSRRPEVRKERSDRLKARYVNGDILDQKTRARVSKSGSDGWVNKINNASDEERKKLLESFSKAGNDSQNAKRHLLTPDDYNKLYPFAKGVARYHNCDKCGNKIISWFGGKPRPKKRFCNQKCWTEFIVENPFYVFKNNVKRYYSKKMETEFCLRSKLELWMANLFEKEYCVDSWCVPPFYIKYEWSGKQRKYFPDFFVNGKYLIEIKSDYIRRLQGEEKTVEKLKAAESFCNKRNYDFFYWQFDGKTSEDLVAGDVRIIDFIERISNG